MCSSTCVCCVWLGVNALSSYFAAVIGRGGDGEMVKKASQFPAACQLGSGFRADLDFGAALAASAHSTSPAAPASSTPRRHPPTRRPMTHFAYPHPRCGGWWRDGGGVAPPVRPPGLPLPLPYPPFPPTAPVASTLALTQLRPRQGWWEVWGGWVVEKGGEEAGEVGREEEEEEEEEEGIGRSTPPPATSGGSCTSW